MCNIYVGARRDSYDSHSRSVRIQGVVTSIRLENRFWDLLDEMALKERKTTPQFINALYNELMASHDEVANFASFLRVACTIYLVGDANQQLPLLAKAS